MEQIKEIVAFGISSILFGICYKRYVKQRDAINGVQVRIKRNRFKEQTAVYIQNIKFTETYE
jgi:hypothetical protein